MLTAKHQWELLALARRAIASGLARESIAISADDYAAVLRQHGCCFVTLMRRARLRGCIGSLSPCRPLVEDVAAQAQAAAFEDPRFPCLGHGEFADLVIEISVLSPQQPVDCSSDEELLAQLVPGEDGLVIRTENSHATFLPSVWQQLPDAREFLRHLKRKAGLADDQWHRDLQVFRYHTESFSDIDYAARLQYRHAGQRSR